MTNPVIFLDFDGVLNSTRSMLAFGGAGRHQFDPVAVNLVARLAGNANANVVVSSAWRVGSSVGELKSILGEYSTTLAAKVIDVTPRLSGKRGNEIASWLAQNPDKHSRNFVILDDDSDMLESQLPYFVQTRHRDGFGLPEYLAALGIVAPTHSDITQLAWYAKDRPRTCELASNRASSLDWGADPC